DLALTSVQSGSYLDSQRVDIIGNRAGAAYRSSRAIERGEKAVAGGVDLSASKYAELPTDQCVMSVKQIVPSSVTKTFCLLCGSHDIGEENSGEHAVSFRTTASAR